MIDIVAGFDDKKKQDPTGGLKGKLATIDFYLLNFKEDKDHKAFLSSGDDPIPLIQSHYSGAQKAVHDTLKKLEDGEEFNPLDADLFHNSFREYMTNLKAVPVNTQFGKTKTPSGEVMKKLISQAEKILEYANKIEGFQDVSHLKIKDTSTAQEAVIYAQRNLREISSMAVNRTMVTQSMVASASKDLKKCLDDAYDAISKVGEDGKPHADQMKKFKISMGEARKQAGFFKDGYLPKQWLAAQRVRAEIIEQKLAADGFEKSVTKVIELNNTPQSGQTRPPGEVPAPKAPAKDKAGATSKPKTPPKPGENPPMLMSAMINPAHFPNLAVLDLGDTSVTPETRPMTPAAAKSTQNKIS